MEPTVPVRVYTTKALTRREATSPPHAPDAVVVYTTTSEGRPITIEPAIAELERAYDAFAPRFGLEGRPRP